MNETNEIDLSEYELYGGYLENVNLFHKPCGKHFDSDPDHRYEDPKNLKEALEWAKKHAKECR